MARKEGKTGHDHQEISKQVGRIEGGEKTLETEEAKRISHQRIDRRRPDTQQKHSLLVRSRGGHQRFRLSATGRATQQTEGRKAEGQRGKDEEEGTENETQG